MSIFYASNEFILHMEVTGDKLHFAARPITNIYPVAYIFHFFSDI